MHRLENYKFEIFLNDFCSSGGAVDDLVLGHLPSLRSVTVELSGTYIISEEVKRSVRKKLKREVAAHPNNPRLQINQLC
jgi:disease resistance protein RPM1